MNPSETGIANLAIAHCGVGVQITNMLTDQSAEARACNVFFDQAKNDVLRDFNWPFSTVFETLQLVANNPTCEWAFSYQYPNDVVRLRRILSGIKIDSVNSRVPYQLAASDTTGSAKKLIYTNFPNAIAEFTGKVKNLAIVDHDFEIALSYRLAFYIAAQLTRGDPFKIGDKCQQLYLAHINRAIATGMNENNQGKAQDTESILARNQGIGVPWRGWWNPWDW